MLLKNLWVILLIVSLGFAADSINELYYNQPAKNWNEALVLGNGRLGAMLFGDVLHERIELNEDTLWTGGPHDYNRKGASKYLPEIRQLLKDKKFDEARILGDQHMVGTPKNLQAYQPLGTLTIDFYNTNKVENYVRKLDMSTGLASVDYTIDGVNYQRETFVSFPDQVIATAFACDKPHKLSFTIKMNSLQPHQTQTTADKTLILKGQVPSHAAWALVGEWKAEGTRFGAEIKILDTNGTVIKGPNSITVSNAQFATILYTAATAFENFKDVSGDPQAKCQKILKAASKRKYKELRKRHIKDHTQLFNRVDLELENKHAKPIATDQRLRAMQSGTIDPFLEAQAFQFGRYLLMASSRPGSQPANLQGIWNKDLRPAWGSKWTININLPMNYWLAESCNLSECHQPLFSLLNDLRIPGRETAKEYYDCGGFVVHHNTDLWRASAVDDGYYFGGWPMGGVWLSTHLWEHYDFTQNKKFLAKAYPIMREAAEFFVDFLIQDENGYWVTSPSISFEQSFSTPETRDGRVCVGPTMDMQILRKQFSNCIEASEILGIDKDFRLQLIKRRDNLAPTKVNPKTGRLLEWRDEREPTHLHDGQLAHLWGLCPGEEITPFKTPTLAAAAEKSLRHRGFRLGSWTSGKTLNYWARLHNSKEYENALNTHMCGYVLPNLMSSFDGGLFQVDGNFGMSASVAEALLQSHASEIHLLPALPTRWLNGSVSGLCARGGFEFDLVWADGKLKEVTITSKSGNSCTIVYKGIKKKLKTKTGKIYKLDAKLDVIKAADNK